jgi:hypothetical protein
MPAYGEGTLVHSVRLLLLIAVAASLAGGAAQAADSQAWWLSAIGADGAAPGPGVPLTLVDRGLDLTRPPFVGRPDTVALDEQTPDSSTAALASVALGVYPRIQLQLWDASPGGTSLAGYSEAIGIETAAAHCPGVIDLPFGTPTPDPFVQTAILIAVRSGCLVVAAAGDGRSAGNRPQYPGAFPHVFSVAATTQQGTPASFSTTSPYNDLSAPGDSLPAVGGSVSGTGYASAIVAAAAAWVWTQRRELDASQVFALLRRTAQPVGPRGWHLSTGFGLLDISAALAARAPARDPGEPNDDIEEVLPTGGYGGGEAALTTAASPSGRISGTLDVADDPGDVYPIWVPPHSTVHIAVRAHGNVAGRIWGMKTLSVHEGLAARQRDLKGQSIRAGAQGFTAYAEVLLTGRVPRASYALVVTAARR